MESMTANEPGGYTPYVDNWSADALIPNASNAYGTAGTPSLIVYRDKLYCIREARDGGGYVWCGSFDGENWSDDQLIPNADNAYGTSGPPSLIVYRDTLFCIREGRGNSGYVWCATFDGTTWSDDQLIPSNDEAYGTSGPPSLIVYHDTLFCIREGRDNSGYVWCATFDGTSWSADQSIPNADNPYGTSGPPSLAVYDDTLFCIREGRHGTGYVWCATYDGTSWSADALIPDADNAYGTSGPPSLIVYQNKLYCIRSGRSDTGYVWCASYDRESRIWSADQLIPNDSNPYGTSAPPSVIEFAGNLLLVREGRADSGWVWCATFDGQTWSQDQLIPSADDAYGCSGPPALIVYDTNLYCIRQGRGDSGYVWCGVLSPSVACPVYPTISVNIWTSRIGSLSSFDFSFGHASLTLSDGTYISWWPTIPGTSKPEPVASMKTLPDAFSSAAVRNRTYDDDVEAEGREPEYRLEIKVLDGAMIRNWWASFRKSTPDYKLLTQNCSTTVWDALRSARVSNFLPPEERQRLASYLVWYPALVEEVARTLSSYY